MSKVKAAILKVLSTNGPHHCGTLAQDTGYTLSTVQRIIKQLMQDGIVVDTSYPEQGHQDLTLRRSK